MTRGPKRIYGDLTVATIQWMAQSARTTAQQPLHKPLIWKGPWDPFNSDGQHIWLGPWLSITRDIAVLNSPALHRATCSGKKTKGTINIRTVLKLIIISEQLEKSLFTAVQSDLTEIGYSTVKSRKI